MRIDEMERHQLLERIDRLEADRADHLRRIGALEALLGRWLARYREGSPVHDVARATKDWL